MANGSARQRTTIVDAAAALLLREGAHGLSVRAVMREAGVSRTAFYRQFDSMHDVLRALLEILGRRGGTPEEFARVTTPIWRHVLFADDAIDEATLAISGDRRRRGGPGSRAGS